MLGPIEVELLLACEVVVERLEGELLPSSWDICSGYGEDIARDSVEAGIVSRRNLLAGGYCRRGTAHGYSSAILLFVL